MPYHECNSFEKCSCNVCPLDPLINEKESFPEEEKCRAEKPGRQKIALKYPNLLPYQGLTQKQFQAKKRWESLSPQLRELRLQGLVKARKSLKWGIGRTIAYDKKD